MAKRYDLSKAELLKRDDAAVQLALGESQIVNDIKDYLVNHGNGFYFRFISGLYLGECIQTRDSRVKLNVEK